MPLSPLYYGHKELKRRRNNAADTHVLLIEAVPQVYPRRFELTAAVSSSSGRGEQGGQTGAQACWRRYEVRWIVQNGYDLTHPRGRRGGARPDINVRLTDFVHFGHPWC